MRQVDAAQTAAAVGRQRLFAAVVHHQAVGIEGMHLLDRHIVNRLDAGGLDRLDRGGEALAVQAAAVSGQHVFESLGLGVVLEADALGRIKEVVAKAKPDHALAGLKLAS